MQIVTIAKRSWAQASQNNIGLMAAGVAFFAFLAMVPLLAAMVLSYGLFADPETVVEQAVAIAKALPQDAASLIIDQMRSMVAGDNAKTAIGLMLALGTAIYGANKGAKAVVIALNAINRVEEPRGFLGQLKASLLITILLIATMLTGFAAIGLLGYIGTLLPMSGPVVHGAIRLLGFLAFGGIAMASLAVIYRYGPAKARASLRSSVIGAAVAAVLIGAGTLGFAIYVAQLGSYNATYGALGAVVILQLWLYLSAFALLLGAQVGRTLDQDPAEG